MPSRCRILIADDEPFNVDIIQTRLAAEGYEILTATDGEQALTLALETKPDLILLDVNMPKYNGFEVCRRLRADPSFPFTPIIINTSLSDSKDVVAGLEAGADEYLTKPLDHVALVARVKSMLRIKSLHDTAREQARQLQLQSEQLAEWNRNLERRVREQVSELERVSRLKRFLAPQLAEMLVSTGGEHLLENHRREISVVFCDLRGFTAFAANSEPEEIMEVLRQYHAAMGKLIIEYQGTLERFTGDGLMVFFNDPKPVPDHALTALRMALEMRLEMTRVKEQWARRGYRLGFGVGMAMGYATLGMVGFANRADYAAIGSVTNLAARLCDAAQDGQILISPQVSAEVEELIETEPVGELKFKGFPEPVQVRNAIRPRPG